MNVKSYRVYYGTAPNSYIQAKGSGVSAGSATTISISGLQLGYTYYFASTAVDVAGQESVYSNEALKLVK